jgi:Ankyrin repeats (3 copies)
MHNPPTILLVSCIYGLTPIIQYLLPRKDVDWNVGYPEDIECSKDIDRYRTIDDVGWNLRRTNNGQIIHPLVLAAGRGYKDIVELVLSRDKSCYTKGDPWYIFGASALCEAVECGHISIVKLLIEHGVDPNSRGLELVNRFTSVIQTPLPLAAASGNQEIARLLLLHKADPNSSCTVFRKG